ncbi:uncharacterized protein [Nicotiana tomentosiformis]|uniref:uncharacterized protein n=1 Tax=Nicotiana tomentosiformis TaxID=4098 RepID=UPI00388C4EC4
MYHLLSEQHEGAIKDLQAGLDESQRDASNLRREHADLVKKVKIFEVSNEDLAMATNDQPSQVQKKIDRIDQFQAEMNEVQAMADGRKSKMDQLVSEKETAQAQLASVEVQLRVAKEKFGKQSQLNDELRSQLSSALADQDALGKECEAIKSQLRTTYVDDKDMVA